MKKITLCSLLMCLGVVNHAIADETFCQIKCTAAREGRVALCPQQSKSEVFVPETKICQNGKWVDGAWRNDNFYASLHYCPNYTKPNGWQDLGKYQNEQNLYVFIKAQKTGVAFTLPGGSIVDGSIDLDAGLICAGCFQGFTWDKKNNKCVVAQKSSIHQGCDPNRSELCNQNDRIEQLTDRLCAGRKEKDRCYDIGENAELGRCVKESATKDGEQYMVCADVKCKPGYYLWLNKNGESQGVCHSKYHMENMCAKNTCGCADGQDCVPNIVDIPSYITINGYNLSASDRKNGAYKECHCVPNSNIEETCKFTFDADIECADGTQLTYNKELKIPKSVFKDGKCTDKNYPTFEDWVNKEQIPEVKKYVLEHCPNAKTKIAKSNVSGGDSRQFTSTKESLDAFFKRTESSKSGLVTAEGKFNTTRLASDLAAGVVLGTVGGVVSGVVIKKKQVEKGFDALHCSVGGQTIADWGDTFEVGLQR